MLTLVEKGMNREDAYSVVQGCAHQAWNKSDGDFRKLISQDETVTQTLSPEEIAVCFDPNHHLKNLDEVYQRLGI
jgi:adenylosuccinate lyase